MTTTPRLVRKNHGKNHSYWLDGRKVPGVTTVLNSLPKNLSQWAADAAANHAVEHWDELSQLPITKRLDRIRYAHRDTLSKAALRGNEIHDLGEKLVKGEPVQVPPEHRGPVEAYARFIDAWDIQPFAVEVSVGSTQYGGFGGTLDLGATIGKRDNVTALIDLKTGKSIYESVVLQLAAYRYCELWQPDGKDTETELDPAQFDEVWVAHITPDDVLFRPVQAGPAQFRQFLYVLQTHHWLERHGYKGDEPLVGDAVRLESVTA